VDYWINPQGLPQAQQAGAIEAVKKAFQAYKLTCSSLDFTYKGTSTSTAWVQGAILVAFLDTATMGSNAYQSYFAITNNDVGDISYAFIKLNGQKYPWTTAGAESGKLDIQTAVTQLIPGIIGYYVGDDPWGGSTKVIRYNNAETTLTQEQMDGVRNLYYKADTGCNKPATPQFCSAIPKPDTGIKEAGVPPSGDGSTIPPVTDGSVSPKYDSSVGPKYDGAISTKDGSTTTPPKDNGGCCRVSQASREGGSWGVATLGLLLLALCVIRRGRR
jgi:hypothetical protein